MPETDIPRPLRKLQRPMQHVLWHELGTTLREYYGDDVAIRQPLTELTRSSFGEKTIALEGAADAAIILRHDRATACLRRCRINEYAEYISVAVGLEIARDLDTDAWLDEHCDELAWVHPEWREE